MSLEHRGDSVFLEDQALRDGLQGEPRRFTLEEKLAVFRLLTAAGLPRIQVGSFVHPAVVPQMADTDALIHRLGPRPGAVVSALILNDRGLARALACGVGHVSMSVSVSDTHSRKNARRPAAAALADMTALIRRARAAGLDALGSLQCVFGCVYEGPIPEEAVLQAVDAMAATGVREVNLADTTGMATPLSIRRLVGRVAAAFPHLRLSLHLHDTRGLGLANMFSGYEAGVRSFDVCAGGLGGCPFVKGAAGNVPTEDAVHMFEAMGVPTGVDLAAACRATAALESLLGRRLPGRLRRVPENTAEDGC
jgi:hydroxymethylglutaryl-CoA lyase